MKKPLTIVYFDGSCSLCRREINLLKRLDKKNRLFFEDVSAPHAANVCPLPQEDMLARFHVRGSDGIMLDGAAAFLTVYAQLPRLSWLQRAANWPIALGILNALYWLFLRIRPAAQWIASKFD